MRANVVDWPENRFGLELALTPDEVELMRKRLLSLSRDHHQHFHLSSSGAEPGRLGDVEIAVMADGAHNMTISSLALAPGTSIPDPRPPSLLGRLVALRPTVAALLGLAGFFQLLETTASAYVTLAAGDYRPVLIRGVGHATVALFAFQASGALARGWKLRLTNLVCGIAVLFPLLQILERLRVVR